MSFALGVDGGNTKTIALVARCDGPEAGVIAGSGRAGCADIYTAGSPEKALEAMESAIDCALSTAGVGREAISAACFSLAGADWPEDFDVIRAGLTQRGLGLGERLLIFNDAFGALRAGAPDGVGVAVVCGTGAAIGARAADGRLWHSSWWQEPQCAVELGEKTLNAIYRAELGLAPPTSLTARVLAFYQLPTVEAVLHLRTARLRAPGPSVGKLARLLLDEAEAGDPTATRLVTKHGADLGDYALVAARQVGLLDQPFALVLAGGVLRHPSEVLRRALIERVQATAPLARPAPSRFEPAVGALLFALEAGGVNVDEALLERVGGSLPGAELFET
jgi:N-acetylglucosamine kinase-like BadF-type ATPase